LKSRVFAAILATLFVVLQLLVWLLAQKHKAADVYYLLSFLPIISMWYFMTDNRPSCPTP
jgi:hypothetical protein